MTDPDPEEPALDPPGLENLRLDADEIARRSGMVDGYVKNEERPPADETPFMADTPFGTGPGIVGGETPFFLSNDAGGFDFEMDDTEGIPTGLPDLHDLSRFPDQWSPGDGSPTLGAAKPAEVVKEIEVRVERVTDTKAVVRAERSGQQRALIAFSAGVFASSLLWGVLVWLLFGR